MRSNDAARGQRGFTLLEVLVALVIFALLFGVLAQIFQTGLRQSRVAEPASAATLLARSQLARVGVEVPLAQGEFEGETEDGLRWRTAIEVAEPPAEDADPGAVPGRGQRRLGRRPGRAGHAHDAAARPPPE